jgi:hypothetical protein
LIDHGTILLLTDRIPRKDAYDIGGGG